MKTTILLTLLIFFTTGLWSQQTITWGPEISVADGAVYGNLRPRIQVTTDGNPVVVFGHGAQGKLYVAKGNGVDFNAPTTLLPQDLQAYLANWTGAEIAANGDTILVIFKAKPFTTGHIYSVRSTDGGATFSDTIRVDDHDTGRTFLPAVEFKENGNPVVSYMTFDDFTELNPQYVVAHSSDGGLSYGNSIPVSTINSAEACDCCPSDLVVNGNSMALLYRNNEVNIRDVFAVLSADGGQNFTTSENLENLNWNFASCPSTGPHGLTLGNQLVVASASAASGNYRVYLSTANWSDLQNQVQYTLMPPTNPTGKQNYPRTSVAGDTVVVVWEERESSNPDVFCSVITDGDLSGLDDYKARINMVETATQTNPDVLIKNGVVHVVFQDGVSGDVIYRKGIIAAADINDLPNYQLQVYPNPSSDGVFHVTGKMDAETLSVTDLNGKQVAFTYSVTTASSIVSLVQPEKGVYLLYGSSGKAIRLVVR